MAKMTETTGESGLLEDIGGEERQKEQFEPM